MSLVCAPSVPLRASAFTSHVVKCCFLYVTPSAACQQDSKAFAPLTRTKRARLRQCSRMPSRALAAASASSGCAKAASSSAVRASPATSLHACLALSCFALACGSPHGSTHLNQSPALGECTSAAASSAVRALPATRLQVHTSATCLHQYAWSCTNYVVGIYCATQLNCVADTVASPQHMCLPAQV